MTSLKHTFVTTLWSTVLFTVGLAACSRGSFVAVTVNDVPANADRMTVFVTNNNQTSGPHEFAVVKGGAFDFSLSFNADRHGDVVVAVEALAGTTSLGKAQGTGTIAPGQTTSLQIDLGPPAADLAVAADLSTVDLTVSDLASIAITPNALPGLKLWVKADTGISDTDAGTNVAVWTDQSGSGNSPFQGGPTLQPTFVPGVLNGLPVVRFDGTQYLNFDGSILVNSNYTVMIVEAPADGMDPNLFIGGGPPNVFGSDNTFLFGYTKANNVPQLRCTQWTHDLDVAVPAFSAPGQFNIDSCLFDMTRGHAVFRVGGLQGSNNYTMPVTQNALAAIGSHVSFWKSYRGDIAEVIIYDVPLSDYQRRGVELYLRNKYGL